MFLVEQLQLSGHVTCAMHFFCSRSCVVICIWMVKNGALGVVIDNISALL